MNLWATERVSWGNIDLNIFTHSLRSLVILSFSWWDREHIPINEAFDNQTFNQMIFAAEEDYATTTTYPLSHGAMA